MTVHMRTPARVHRPRAATPVPGSSASEGRVSRCCGWQVAQSCSSWSPWSAPTGSSSSLTCTTSATSPWPFRSSSRSWSRTPQLCDRCGPRTCGRASWSERSPALCWLSASSTRRPPRTRTVGRYGFQIIWRGLIYGSVDAMTLYVFPAAVAYLLMRGNRNGLGRKAGFAGLALDAVAAGHHHLSLGLLRVPRRHHQVPRDRRHRRERADRPDRQPAGCRGRARGHARVGRRTPERRGRPAHAAAEGERPTTATTAAATWRLGLQLSGCSAPRAHSHCWYAGNGPTCSDREQGDEVMSTPTTTLQDYQLAEHAIAHEGDSSRPDRARHRHGVWSPSLLIAHQRHRSPTRSPGQSSPSVA